MKVAIIGASGFIGSKILAEALSHNHKVTAIVRHPKRVPHHRNLTVSKSNILWRHKLAQILKGHDAVISSWNTPRGVTGPQVYDRWVDGNSSILAAVNESGVKRFLAVGGASSLKTPEGIELLDSPQFPKAFEPARPAMRGVRELFYMLKKEPELDWVFFSPAVMIVPGVRTGKYRLGTDRIVADAKGESRISVEDYAVAMIDELEHPKHHRDRFTIGY
ncbi:MAG: NAD(P)-dependent oxidoreductase [Candidatus Acidiferrales bacterium]